MALASFIVARCAGVAALPSIYRNDPAPRAAHSRSRPRRIRRLAGWLTPGGCLRRARVALPTLRATVSWSWCCRGGVYRLTQRSDPLCRDCPRRGASVGGILLPLVWHRHVRQPEVRALSEVPEWALGGEVQTRGLPSFLRSLLQPVNPWVGDSWQIYNEYYQWDNGARTRGCMHSPPPWLAATPAPPRLSRVQLQQRSAHREGGRLALWEHHLQPREPVLHDLPQGPHGRLVRLDEHPRREGQERRVQGARLAACQWRWKRP